MEKNTRIQKRVKLLLKKQKQKNLEKEEANQYKKITYYENTINNINATVL